MGCASSNPIVQSGKQFVDSAKDSVTEALDKGEHVLHDVGDMAKERIEHVKEAVGVAATTAETGFENVVEKVGHAFSSGDDETEGTAISASERAEKEAKQISNVAVDTVVEVASESENGEEEFMTKRRPSLSKKTISLTDEFGEVISAEAKESVNEALRIEDIEDSTFEAIDNNLKDMKKKAEDLVNGLPGPPPTEPVETKEEPAPTFWEAAADAVLHQKIRSLPRQPYPLDDNDGDDDGGGEQGEKAASARVEKQPGDLYEADLFRKERMRPPEIIINSENLSIKSYKSEI